MKQESKGRDFQTSNGTWREGEGERGVSTEMGKQIAVSVLRHHPAYT